MPSRFSVFFSIFLVAALLFSGCGLGSPEKAFVEAESLLSRGDYTGALAAYSSIVTKYPESPQAPVSQYKKARILSRYLGDVGKAMEAYSELFFLYPESEILSDAAEDRALIYSEKGEHWRAIEQYRWALNGSDPGDWRRIKRLVAAELTRVGDFTGARKEFEDLVTEAHGAAFAAEIFFRIATTYYLEGAYKEAIDAYDKVIEDFPDDPFVVEAMLGKASSLEESGELKEALAVLKQLEGAYKDPDVLDARIASVEKRIKKASNKKKRKRRRR